MHKKIILFLAVTFVFQFCFFPAARADAPKDAVDTEQEKADLDNTWDFGSVRQGVLLKHEFTLKNTADKVLEINSIHTSCGCTASESGKKTLLPQESTLIKATFNSRGYVGKVQQFVYVNTDNPDLAIIKFTIKADVVKKK